MEKRMTRIAQGIVLSTASLFFGLIVPFAVAQDAANLPYMNPNLSPEQRAVDLVHRMTLAEKASQMQNNSAAIPRLNGSRLNHPSWVPGTSQARIRRRTGELDQLLRFFERILT